MEVTPLVRTTELNRGSGPHDHAAGKALEGMTDKQIMISSDILVLKLISVLVFILFSSQNFNFI